MHDEWFQDVKDVANRLDDETLYEFEGGQRYQIIGEFRYKTSSIAVSLGGGGHGYLGQVSA